MTPQPRGFRPPEHRHPGPPFDHFGQPAAASVSTAELYLTGQGRDVAAALGIPVHRSGVLPYGTVVEDRTTGDLRLIVGTYGRPSPLEAALAATRRDAVRIVRRGLAGYGDAEDARRTLKRVDAEELLARMADETVAAAETIARPS